MGEAARPETPLRQLVAWLSEAKTLLALLVAIAGLAAQLPTGFRAAWVAWAGIAITVLALAWLGLSAYRAWTRPAAGSRVSTSPSVQIRGAKPFEDGDQLMGRSREVAELFTTVRALEFRFGYLSGQAGAGKTSLLRAGLTGRLRSDAPNWRFAYVPRAGARPDLEILRSLKALFPERVANETRLSDACEKILPLLEAPLLIACDQFEEYFLAARSSESREAVTAEFKRVWEISREDGRLRILFCLRKEFVDDLLSFAKLLPELRFQDWRCTLSNFHLDVAEAVLEQMVEAGEINLSPQLRRRVAADLAHDGFVRPVELQIVLSRMVEQRVRDLPAYDARGGAFGILSRFIVETIDPPDEPAPEIDRQVGRHLLRALCADNFAARRPGGLSENDLAARVLEQMKASSGGTTFSREDVGRSLARLVAEFRRARVLVDEDEDHINLAHDYLAAAVRDATADIESAEERANRLLDQYVSQARLSKSSVLPYRVLRNVSRYASAEARERTEARRLITRSTRWYALVAAAGAALIVAAITWALPFGWQTRIVDRFEQKDIALVSAAAPLALLPSGSSLRLYRLDRNEIVRVLPTETNEFSPAGDRILVGGTDGSVSIAEAEDSYRPRVVVRRAEWNDPYRSGTMGGFSADGRWAHVIDADGNLYAWPKGNPARLICRLRLPQMQIAVPPPRGSGGPERTVLRPEIPTMTLAPDGKHIVVVPDSFGQGDVLVLETRRACAAPPEPIGQTDGARPTFSPDGSHLAWIDDNHVWVKDLRSRANPVTFPAREMTLEPGLIDNVRGVWFSPDSSWLVIGYGRGDFDQWRVGTPPRFISAVKAPPLVPSLAESPVRRLPRASPVFDRHRGFVLAESVNGLIFSWSLARPPGANSRPLLSEIDNTFFRQVSQAAQFCPGGRSAILAGTNGALYKFQPTLNPRLTPSARLALGQVRFRPAADADFVVAFNSSELAFGPCSEGEMTVMRFGAAIREVVASADGRELLVIDENGVSRVRRSFMLWGLPIRTGTFPRLTGYQF